MGLPTGKIPLLLKGLGCVQKIQVFLGYGVRASKMLVSALPLGFFGSCPCASALQGEGKPLEPVLLDWPHRSFSHTEKRQPPFLQPSLRRLQPQPGQALAAMHKLRASPIYHKETGAGRDLGPNSAVPSSFKQGEVGWPEA